MPTFKPNSLYGPNGYDMTADDGSIYPDPFGVVKGESDPTGVLAQTAALAPVPPAVPDVRLASNDPGAGFNPQPASVADIGGAQMAPPPQLVPQQPAAAAPGVPPDPAGMVGSAGAPAAPPDPASWIGADAKTTSGSSVTSGSTSETGSTGLSAADQAAARGDVQAASAAGATAADARQATTNLEAQQATTRSAELLASSADAQSKIAADTVINDHLNSEVERKLKAGAEFRPDRTELFGGDHGAAFTLSAAVAAMAGGWLMGVGKTKGNPYLDVVLKVIDDNANDQIRQNSSVVQELMRQKGDIQAVKADIKARQLRVADQLLEARMLRDKSQLIQSQGAATRAQFAAEDSKYQAEQRKALFRTESKKLSTTLNKVTTTSTVSGATDEARQVRIGNLRKLDQRINTLAAGIKSGAADGVVGITNRKLGLGLTSPNDVRRMLGTMPPEQLAQLNNLNDLAVDSVVSLKNEPSPRVAALIQDLNVPQSDAELQTFLTRLQAARNALAEDLQKPGQYATAPQPESVEAGPR